MSGWRTRCLYRSLGGEHRPGRLPGEIESLVGAVLADEKDPIVAEESDF
jgi:hypothetical protein